MIFFLYLICCSAYGVNCDFKQLEADAEKALKKADIIKVYKQDNEMSFQLKVIVPYLLKDKVLFSESYITCKTIEDENLESFKGCYEALLGKKEKEFFEQYYHCHRKKPKKNQLKTNSYGS